MKIRPSNLKAVADCRAWLKENAEALNMTSGPARGGQSGHAIYAIMAIERREPTDAELEALCLRFPEIERNDLDWTVIKGRFLLDLDPDWTAYIEFRVDLCHPREPVQLMAGTVDLVLISPDGKTAIVVDWKMGRVEVDPPWRNHQLTAYAMAVFQRFPTLQSIDASIVMPNLRYHESHTFARADMDAKLWAIADLCEEANAENPEYHPGCATCEDCPAKHTCPALNAVLSPAVTGMSFAQRMSEAPLGEVVLSVPVIRAAKKMIADAEKALKRRCDAEGGSIQLADGSWYARTEQVQRQIDARAGWQVLCDRCGPFLADAVTIAKGKIKDAARAYTEHINGDDLKRGWKSGCDRELMTALDHADAFKSKIITKYQIVKALPEPKESEDNEDGKES